MYAYVTHNHTHTYMCESIYSFNGYLKSAYCKPGTVLRNIDILVNQKKKKRERKMLPQWGFHFSRGASH